MGKKLRSKGYVVSVRGPLPTDLVERISHLHAVAILHRLSKTRIDQPESTDSPNPVALGFFESAQRSYQERQAETPTGPIRRTR